MRNQAIEAVRKHHVGQQLTEVAVLDVLPDFHRGSLYVVGWTGEDRKKCQDNALYHDGEWQVFINDENLIQFIGRTSHPDGLLMRVLHRGGCLRRHRHLHYGNHLHPGDAGQEDPGRVVQRVDRDPRILFRLDHIRIEERRRLTAGAREVDRRFLIWGCFCLRSGHSNDAADVRRPRHCRLPVGRTDKLWGHSESSAHLPHRASKNQSVPAASAAPPPALPARRGST